MTHHYRGRAHDSARERFEERRELLHNAYRLYQEGDADWEYVEWAAGLFVTTTWMNWEELNQNY